MAIITHEQNIICRKTRLDGTTHEQTIICGQLFAGHVVDSRPIEREEKTNRMIIRDICTPFGPYLYSTKCSWITNKYISCRLQLAVLVLILQVISCFLELTNNSSS